MLSLSIEAVLMPFIPAALLVLAAYGIRRYAGYLKWKQDYVERLEGKIDEIINLHREKR